MPLARADRDQSLETLRGMACLSVVLWHVMLGFFPARSGIFGEFPKDQAINGFPFFGLINGTAAVAFFFVLSGFVLTRSFFLVGDRHLLVRNAIKRWPRLALMVTIVVLLSYLLFRENQYQFEQAAAITQSPWLKKFAFAYDRPFTPDFGDALRQGIYRTFLYGDSYYDSSLWTMRYEFIGSFVAFGFAAVLGPRAPLATLLLLSCVLLAIVYAVGGAWYAAFPVGVILAATLPEKGNISTFWSVSGIALALYLAGYSGADRGAFHPLAMILGKPQIQTPMNVWIIGAAVMIISVSQNERLRSILSNSGGAFLGWISFPLYLVHVPILCSVGCLTFLNIQAELPGPVASSVAAIATIAASIFVSVPLALLNDRWISMLNHAVDAATLGSASFGRRRDADEPYKSEA